jgi:hypothetical protein
MNESQSQTPLHIFVGMSQRRQHTKLLQHDQQLDLCFEDLGWHMQADIS